MLEQIEYDFELSVAIYIAGIANMLATNTNSGKNKNVESTKESP